MLLAFKQAPYEVCSLNRINIVIIFSGAGIQKVHFLFMIFTTQIHKNFKL
jgi:hypothetical protein